MKTMYILPVVLALLSGCVKRIPCMEPNESGTVVRSTTDSGIVCGRSGCENYVYSYITIKVKGVARTCVIDDSTANMFRTGDVINLRTGKRL